MRVVLFRGLSWETTFTLCTLEGGVQFIPVRLDYIETRHLTCCNSKAFIFKVDWRCDVRHAHVHISVYLSTQSSQGLAEKSLSPVTPVSNPFPFPPGVPQAHQLHLFPHAHHLNRNQHKQDLEKKQHTFSKGCKKWPKNASNLTSLTPVTVYAWPRTSPFGSTVLADVSLT